MKGGRSVIFHLWKYEWKRMLKRPGLFLFTLLFPIAVIGLISLFLYTTASDELESVHLLVLDEDQTFETNALIKQLQDDQTIDGEVFFNQGKEDLSYYLEQPDEYAAIVQIPEGFTEQLSNGVNESINVYLNENLPIASNLAYLLLESGQDYISAAQTGVNTVNHFHIKSMEDTDERQQFLQQSIVHFTTYSLGRNSFFEEVSSEGMMLSWSMQAFIILTTLLILFTYWLLVILNQPKHQPIIQKRLNLISVTRFDQLIAQWLYQLTYLMLYIIVMVLSLSYFVFPTVEIDLNLITHWLTIGVGLTLLYTLIRLLIPTFILSVIIFTVGSLILMMISGLLLPPIYLPEHLSILSFIYEGFEKIWLQDNIPMVYWIGVGIATLIGLLVLFIVRKIGVVLK